MIMKYLKAGFGLLLLTALIACANPEQAAVPADSQNATDTKTTAAETAQPVEKSEEPVKAEEPAKEEEKDTPVEETEPAIDWESEIATIAKDGSLSSTQKADRVEIMAGKYVVGSLELMDFEKYIVDEYKEGRYLEKADDDVYMLTNIFKAKIVEMVNGDIPLAQFAFDFYQNTKYVYRGVDTPDSESVKSNEEQMDKALR